MQLNQANYATIIVKIDCFYQTFFTYDNIVTYDNFNDQPTIKSKSMRKYIKQIAQ